MLSTVANEHHQYGRIQDIAGRNPGAHEQIVKKVSGGGHAAFPKDAAGHGKEGIDFHQHERSDEFAGVWPRESSKEVDEDPAVMSHQCFGRPHAVGH